MWNFARLFRQVSKTSRQFSRHLSVEGQQPYSSTIKWHAAMNFVPKPRDVPVYHYPIILTSVFIFCMYCAVFREENEYDSHFGRLTIRKVDSPNIESSS